MKTNIKMRVNEEQSKKVQEIWFKGEVMFDIFKRKNNNNVIKILQEKNNYLHDELDILADNYNTMEQKYIYDIRILKRRIKELEKQPPKTIIKYVKGN